MPTFDSPAVEALVERARTPLDAGSIHHEVATALRDMQLSTRDRGHLLLAQLVLLQGHLSAEEATAQTVEVLALLKESGEAESLISALAISAMISAAAGDRATCLERCLDMSSLVRSNPDTPVSYRASANFAAALIVLGAYDLAAPLLIAAIQACLRDDEAIGALVSCANLAMAISRRALVTGKPIVEDAETLARLDVMDACLQQLRAGGPGAEMDAFISAVLANSAQLRGDAQAADDYWGDLDSFTAHPSGSFVQYFCLVEAPVALRRGDIARAQRLIERTLDHLETPHIVPLGRVDALQIRSSIHEQLGDLDTALRDAREATDLALSETSGLADLLIAQVDKRAALENSQQVLLDRASDLSEQALVDELSQVGNRRAYEMRMAALASGPEVDVAVVLCDIDNFKTHINDRFGHSFGDAVIARAGAITTQACGCDDALFRYGGDEFIVLRDGVTLDEAIELAERVRKAFVNEKWTVNGAPVNITCSIGVWTGTSSSIEHGVAEADRQLYAAKKAGRNVVRVALPELTPNRRISDRRISSRRTSNSSTPSPKEP